MTGIYRILHLPTNSVYIGQTSRAFQTRWNEHKSQLNDGSHNNWMLRELWGNSSPDEFEFQEISKTPSFFTPLNAQILRALEEKFEIESHKKDGFKVLNITDGEAVITKKAWDELIKNHKKNESLRIKNIKNKHLHRTGQRRELEALKEKLSIFRSHLLGGHEQKLNRLQNILGRKSVIYKIFGLIPDAQKRQSLLNEIANIEGKISERNKIEGTLRADLAAQNHFLSQSPTHGEISDIYAKVKREAYRLRNHQFELKERALSFSEIPLDLIRPNAQDTLEALDYIELITKESKNSVNLDSKIDMIQRSIITLYKASMFEQAQGYLGLSILYRDGLFLNQDIDRARKFYLKALSAALGDMEMDSYWKHDLIEQYQLHFNNPIAEQNKIRILEELSSKGYEFAQFELGEIYLRGESISKDVIKAFDLIKNAAAAGHSWAQYELGLMYLDGEAVPVDDNQAFKLILQAAEANVPDAAYTLGWMYESGSGCELDLIKAYTWYLIYSKDKFSGDMQEELLRVAALLSEDQKELATSDALRFFE